MVIDDFGAECIMFGLTVAAILSLIVTPVLYAVVLGVHADEAATSAAGLTLPAEPKGT
jgi:hypothetical protein